MVKSFFELFRDINICIIIAITSTVVCVVGKYRDFDFVEIGSFKLSFDFMFFVALVCASVAWILLSLCLIDKVFSFVYGKILLSRIKKTTRQEKDFLYNRVYNNGNELRIDMNDDPYFYKRGSIDDSYEIKLHKKNFNTKEKVIKFLRGLENKGIIKNYGNQSMIIPLQVWNILIKNADEIFKDYDNEKEN